MCICVCVESTYLKCLLTLCILPFLAFKIIVHIPAFLSWSMSVIKICFVLTVEAIVEVFWSQITKSLGGHNQSLSQKLNGSSVASAKD